MTDNEAINTLDILERGYSCLIQNLGVIGAERFIATVLREQFDYTQWRRHIFDGMSGEEFNDVAVKYAKEHPFMPKKPQIKI